jgi:hypothetical protein
VRAVLAARLARCTGWRWEGAVFADPDLALVFFAPVLWWVEAAAGSEFLGLLLAPLCLVPSASPVAAWPVAIDGVNNNQSGMNSVHSASKARAWRKTREVRCSTDISLLYPRFCLGPAQI